MDADLVAVKRRLDDAVQPEDVFGFVEWDAAERSYKRLAKAVYPDRHPDDWTLADTIMRSVNMWWERAKLRHGRGRWGVKGADVEPVTLTSRAGSYTVDGTIWRRGDIADLYRTTDGLIVKVTRNPADNDLMRGEATTLKQLRSDPAQAEYHAFVPELVESFEVMLDGARRIVNVLKTVDGLVSLEDVIVQQGPLEAKHVAWIWRRLLKILGYSGSLGIVHGAVVAAHVLIDENHALVLADWCYAVKENAPLKAIPGPSRALYPEVVFTKAPVTPALDASMGVRTMVRLLGGDGKLGLVPPSVKEPRLRRYFEAWYRYPTLAVPDAWTLNREFTELIDSLWPRQFQPLSLSRA